MVIHKLAHHSGRYDNHAIEQAFAQVSAKSSVISHTEFANDARAKRLKAAAGKAGWGFAQQNTKPYDECCFTWDNAAWELVDTAWKTLSTIPWYSGSTGNKMPDFTAFSVFLRHKTSKEQWIFVTTHTPSHVAVWTGFRPPSNRVKCYQDGVKTLGQWVGELDKKWRQSGIVVAADWNAPCEQKWFRSYLEKNFAAAMHVMEPNTKAPTYPDTHDTRCIDWAILGGGTARRGVSSALKVADSDHKTLLYSVSRKT
jgi:hypothetical protein